MSTRVALLVSIVLAPSIALSQTITCDCFDPKVALQANQLTGSLDTDLPDFTQVMVSISRSYWAGAPVEEYPLDYLESRATVGEWRKPRVVNVDHSVWSRKLDERLQMLAVAGEPVKVGKVDTDLTISFTVPINQADSRFGPGNRNLVGKQVAPSGLRVVRSEYPLGAAARPASLEFGSPEALKPGVKYRLSRETPLVPERHPTDPLRATALIRSMPAGTSISVLSVDRSDQSNPWYCVRAASSSGIALGDGWVNSTALIGQKIKVIEP